MTPINSRGNLAPVFRIRERRGRERTGSGLASALGLVHDGSRLAHGTRSWRRWLALPPLVALLLAGCSGGSSSPSAPVGPRVASIVTYPARVGLAVGSTATLLAQALDASGAPVTATVTWASSGSRIVSVSGTTATGIANGSASLTASVGSVTSTPVPVGVSDPGSASQKIQAALDAGTIDATTALKYRIYANYLDSRLPPEYFGNQPPGHDDATGVSLALSYNSLSSADQADLGPYFLPPIYADSWWTPRAAPVATGGTTTLAVAPGVLAHATARPIAHSGGRPGSCSGLLNPGWLSVDSTHFRVWYNPSIGPRDATYATQASAAAEDAYAGLVSPAGNLNMRPPIADFAASPCNGGDDRLDLYIVGPESMGSVGAFALTVPITANSTYSVFLLINREGFETVSQTPGTLSGEPTVYHEFMHAVQAAYRNNAIGVGTMITEATAVWAEDFIQPTGNSEHYYNKGFQNDSGAPLSSNLEASFDQHWYGSYLFYQFATRAVDSNGAGYGGPAVIRSLFEILDATDPAAIQTSGPNDTRLAVLDQALPRGLSGTFADYAVAAWNTAPYDVFNQMDNMNVPAHVSRTTAVTVLTGGVSRVDMTPLSDTGAYQNVNELSARYDRFTFDDSVSTVTFYNGFTNALDQGQLQMTDPYMTPTVTAGAGDSLRVYPPSPQELGKRHVTALFRVGTNWTREDWTGAQFRPFCREQKNEHIDELIVIYANAGFTDIRGEAGVALNALSWLSYPASGNTPLIGTAPSQIISTNLPCYQMQGKATGTVHVTEAGNDFTVTTAMDAVLRGAADQGIGTYYGRPVTVMPGWKFQSVSGSNTMTLTGNMPKCTSAYLNQTATPLNLATLSSPVSFRVLTNYTSTSAAAMAYTGSSTTMQFEVQCSLGPAMLAPASFDFNFDANWASPAGEKYFYVDRVNRKLQATDIDTPLYATGAFSTAIRGTTSWCFVASKEGETPPAGACP